MKNIQPQNQNFVTTLMAYTFSKKLNPTALHLKALDKLLIGRTKSARLEQLHHKHKLCSIRVNKTIRIIGVEDEGRFMVIRFFDNHEYNQLKFINTGVLDLEAPSPVNQIINQSLKETKSTDSSVWRKGHFFNRKAIFFSDIQDQVINNETLPLIVTGAAGSGKTLIVVKILVNAYLAGKLPAVYVAPTPELAQHAQKLFREQIAQLGEARPPEEPQVTFLSVEQFIDAHKPQDSVLAPQGAVIEWLKTYKTQTKDAKQRILLSQPQRVLEEFKIIASKFPDKAAYLKLGEQQTLYTGGDRELCYLLYLLYTNRHPKQCQMAFPTLVEAPPQYNLLIVDEGQSFTIKQLREITRFVINGQFLIFGDPLQNFHNKISVFPQVKQWLYDSYKIKNPFIILPTTYRNPLPVIQFNENVLHVRRLLLDGIEDPCETLTLITPEADDPDALPVEWLETIDEVKTQELAILLNKPDSMVITSSEASRINAEQLFNNPTILLDVQTQGLEAATVFVYCLFTADLIESINTYLRGVDCNQNPTNLPKKTRGTNEFTNDLNRLFTAATRVTQTKGRLIVYLGESVTKRDRELFFSLLTKGLSKANPPAAVEEKAASKQEWQDWIKKLYESGNKEEAYRLFGLHINTGEKDYETLVGKQHAEAKNPPLSSVQQDSKPPVPSEENKPRSRNRNVRRKQLGAESNASKSRASSSLVPRDGETAVRAAVQPIKAPIAKLTKEEMHANYANGLLGNFTPANAEALLKHPRVDYVLFTPFILRENNTETTIFTAIINKRTSLLLLNNCIQVNPLLGAGTILKSGQAITEILNTIEALSKSESDKGKNNLTLFNLRTHRLEIMTIFRLFVTNKPDLSKFITTYHLQQHLLFALIDSSSYFLYKLINLNPTLFSELIDLMVKIYIEDKEQALDWKWCIPLLESQIGAAIITRLYEINPKVLSLFSKENLIAHSLTPSGTLLYFWLSTTKAGQVVVRQLLPQNPESLNALINTSDLRCHGTTTQFWLNANTPNIVLDKDPQLRSKQLSMPQEFTGLSYPSAFRAKSEDVELINFITLLPLTEQLFIKHLPALLQSENRAALLFDYVNGAGQTLFSRIAHTPIIQVFLQYLNKKPKYYQMFTKVRLDQEVKYEDEVGQDYVESVFYTLISEDQQFFTNLFKHNPAIHNAIDAEMLIKESYIHFENKNRWNILRHLVAFNTNIPTFLSLCSRCFTPALAAELLKLYSPKSGATKERSFHFFMLFLVDKEAAYRLVESHPILLEYFTAEHLATEFLVQEIMGNTPKIVYYLANSTPGKLILLKLIQKNPSIISMVTAEDFISKPLKGLRLLSLLCFTPEGYAVLNLFALHRPELFRDIRFAHLKDEIGIDKLKISVFEDLCLNANSHPVILQLLLENKDFVGSMDAEFILKKTEIFYSLSHDAVNIRTLDRLCQALPVLCNKMTKDLLFGRKPVKGKNSMTLFKRFYDLFKPEIVTGKDNILFTLFTHNPSLVDEPINSNLSGTALCEKASKIQYDYLVGNFFAPPKSGVKSVPPATVNNTTNPQTDSTLHLL